LRKPLKIVAILLGVVIGLLLLAAIALVVLVDPNRYRDDLVRVVKEQTGRDLAIEGDLRLSFWPLGLKTGGLQLANAKGFGPEPFARVDSAAVSVRVLPLLRREVVVEGVHFDGLELHLARDRAGRTNWDDLVKTDRPAAPPKDEAPAPSPGDALALFTVNRVEVRNSALTWRDAASGAAYAVRRLELASGNLLGSVPVPLRLAFDLEAGAPANRERVELDARLNLDPRTQALNVPELSAAVGELKLKGEIAGKQIFESPRLSGRVEIAQFNPRTFMNRFGVAYAPGDAQALRALAAAMRFDASEKAVALKEIDLRLDDARVTGQVAVNDLARPAYRFDIGVDRFDLDRYLPPETKTEPQAKQEAAAGAVVIPLALLRELDAQGKLKVGSLKAFGIRSESVMINVAARGGRIALGPNSAKLYGGQYAGRTTIDASGKVPRFQFEEKLAAIQLGPFLKDADVFDRYTGTGNLDIKLTAQGLDAEQVTKTLNGTVNVALRDGKIQGVDLQKMITQARAAYDTLRGKTVRVSTQASDETAFDSLTATVRVTNGVARNDDLKLQGPVVRATGKGSANLVKQTLDYRLQVTLAEGAGRTGSTVPLAIGGTFASPSYAVAIGELIKEEAREAIKEKVAPELEKKLDERLERLRKKLTR